MSTIITIKKYDSLDKPAWNHFIQSARQQSILFNRDYIDYHQDRFKDHSLLFYAKNQLVALLPANEKDNILYSHQGLTYGGLLYSSVLKTQDIINVTEALMAYLTNNNFTQLSYKPSPAIYHTSFSEEDIYALAKTTKLNLTSIEVSTAIAPNNRGRVSSIRKRGIKKALTNGIIIKQSNTDLANFYSILNVVLQENHNTTPVHSLPELQQLVETFPENIQLWSAVNTNNDIIAGILVYQSSTVAHVQYIAATDTGKKLAALDLLFDKAIPYYLEKGQIVEFGKSTENMGTVLNEGLLYQKESLGGTAINYYSYALSV